MAEAEIKPVRIVADSRETRAGIAIKLARFPGVTVDQVELTSGDYLIAPNFAVERKDAVDFVNSLMEGRLFEQIARMQVEYERAAVLIEGDIYDTRSAISPEALDGALSYLSLLSGVHLIQSPSLAATPRLIWRMAIHMQHGLGYLIPLRAQKPRGPGPVAQYIIEGLPGVGPTMARKLIEHFGTPRAVLSADREALCQVKGVGGKTADGIIAALDGKMPR